MVALLFNSKQIASSNYRLHCAAGSVTFSILSRRYRKQLLALVMLNHRLCPPLCARSLRYAVQLLNATPATELWWINLLVMKHLSSTLAVVRGGGGLFWRRETLSVEVDRWRVAASRGVTCTAAFLGVVCDPSTHTCHLVNALAKLFWITTWAGKVAGRFG